MEAAHRKLEGIAKRCDVKYLNLRSARHSEGEQFCAVRRVAEGKATNQVMSIVRYADDFVILAREWADGFVQRIENELENRFGLVVKRGKKRILDMKADRSALSFLGYEFRCTISSVASTSFELVLRSRRRMDVH